MSESDKKSDQIHKNTAREILLNASMSRSAIFKHMIDPRRDIDEECGYPTELSIEDYRLLFNREGLATRAVTVYPEESWSDDPVITDQPEDVHNEKMSLFEQQWKALNDRLAIFSYLLRADVLSGIGRFGILFLGMNDGKNFHEPVVKAAGLDLLYFRTFDEESVSISSWVTDPKDPRYGQPLLYSIAFSDPSSTLPNGNEPPSENIQYYSVHYTRVIHLADFRETSEVIGTPRLQFVFNRMADLRKILGGSGEMFWKGAFPGYSFEVDPMAGSEFEGGVEVDKESIREEFEKYSNGLQRYLALEGVTAKSLSPQVADPSQHVETQTKVVSMCLGVPHRIFIGSEEAKLASSEDTKRWNKRLAKRREKYLNPFVIRPLVDRLIDFGLLPSVVYSIIWPDLNEDTPKVKADIFETKARAFTQLMAVYNADGPLSFKDLHIIAKEQGLSKEEFSSIVQDVSNRGGEIE